jgi:pantoate--beta-alanine ligase
VFVNPTQFSDPGDLDAYPRDEAADVAAATAAGAHVIFVPTVEEVYPAGFTTGIHVDGPVTGTLEGVVRGRAHFAGVATVVTKLFGMVQPDAAFFGQKDAQQCVLIHRLITDLDLPIELVVCPTVREHDGLAMSSRNARLRDGDRERALALVEGLRAADRAIALGETEPEEITAVTAKVMLARGVVPDYVALVDPSTLEPVRRLDRTSLLAVAAPVGPVRLIDNLLVAPPH